MGDDRCGEGGDGGGGGGGGDPVATGTVTTLGHGATAPWRPRCGGGDDPGIGSDRARFPSRSSLCDVSRRGVSVCRAPLLPTATLVAGHNLRDIIQVLVDISKTQDEEIGDGTTSVAVLCGEMLREAEKLIEARIHPQTIVQGWRIACQVGFLLRHKCVTENARIMTHPPAGHRPGLAHRRPVVWCWCVG